MNKLKKIDIYTIPLIFVCLAAAALRSFALLTSFNTDTMHFDDKTAITIGGTIVIISTLGFLSYLIFGQKEQQLIARSDNPASYIPAGIVSTALLFMGTHNVKMFMQGYPKGIISSLALVAGIFAFLSAISFFMSIFIERPDNMYKAAFSLCIVLFLAIYATLLYFNKQIHPTNSPNRFVDQMAYLSAAIFFLYEARIPLGRAKWRGYVAFGLVATLLCTYSSIPSLVLYFTKGYVVSESVIESILALTIALLTCSKVLQTKNLTPDYECETAKNIAAMALMREEEMKERHAHPHAQDSNIMEENDLAEAENYTMDIPFAEDSTKFTTDDVNTDKN